MFVIMRFTVNLWTSHDTNTPTGSVTGCNKRESTENVHDYYDLG